MFKNITRLQTRFFICYLFAIFLPVVLLGSMIYYYHNDRNTKEYLNDKKNYLVTEQNYLENQLDSSRGYYNQLKSNYELRQLLKGFYTSEREIVYSYNSQIYSLLSSIFLYDPNLDGITIYSRDEKTAEILKLFEPISAFSMDMDASGAAAAESSGATPAETLNASADTVSTSSYPQLIDGFWTADKEEGTISFSFYIGFSDSPMTIFPGIARLKYNSSIFDTCAEGNPDSIYIYLDSELLYQYRTTPEADLALSCHSSELLSTNSVPQLLQDFDHNCVISSTPLEDGVFHVIKITPMEGGLFSHAPFLLSLLVSILVLICASILIFLLIFRPLKNIVLLSEHMNGQKEHTLTPYTGKLTKDETGDLILSFNRMAERINELSSSLLNHEIQLKNAQLEALQAQLNPHFFYGTLESIRMIAEASHQELISEIAFSFGNLMRYSLSREYLVPVEKELEMTRQYVSIQEKRLENRFDIIWELAEFDSKWRCPKFVLFSMVENVFSHNVSKCRSFIHITISIQKEGEDMLFTVTNTGPGISPERLAQLHDLLEHPEKRDTLKSENNGRSIFNISDRLKLFYGDNYRFTIESEQNVLTSCQVRIHEHLINF